MPEFAARAALPTPAFSPTQPFVASNKPPPPGWRQGLLGVLPPDRAAALVAGRPPAVRQRRDPR